MKKTAIGLLATCVMCSHSYAAAEKNSTFGNNMDLELSAHTEYVSNLYNLSDNSIDDIDNNNDDGEKYDGIESADDIKTQIGFEVTSKHKLGKKRKLQLGIFADYYFHAYNSISDYFKFGADIGYDITKDDSLGFKVDYIPTRFKKNYIVYGVVDSYEDANYSQISAGMDYSRDWNKLLDTEVSYTFTSRTFDSPFSDRDRTSHEVMVMAEFDTSKRVDMSIGAGYGIADTPTESIPSLGIERDRSFQSVLFEAEMNINMPRKWEASIGINYEYRDYTSDAADDPVYHDRNDDIWKYSFALEKELSTKLDIVFDASLRNKTSNRSDETGEEEKKYNNYTLGVGLNYEF